MTEPEELHRKYRPVYFDDLVGQDDIAISVKNQIDSGTAKTFLFTGGSGCGKTTLARAIANHLDIDLQNRIEIDAATYTGIDAMREVTEKLQYTALGKSPYRIVIVDEIHALSKNAFQSLLKWIEEPPPNVYWVLCTTEPDKVPKTIKTRCHHYFLKPLDADTLADLITTVAELEDIKLEPSAIQLISEESDGSPRQALVYLSMSRSFTTRAEVREIIRSSSESEPLLDMCRWLVSGRALTWQKAVQYASKLTDENPESVRLGVIRYLTKVALNSRTTEDAGRLLYQVECFSGQVYNQSEGIAPLLLALGNIVFDEE